MEMSTGCFPKEQTLHPDKICKAWSLLAASISKTKPHSLHRNRNRSIYFTSSILSVTEMLVFSSMRTSTSACFVFGIIFSLM